MDAKRGTEDQWRRLQMLGDGVQYEDVARRQGQMEEVLHR